MVRQRESSSNKAFKTMSQRALCRLNYQIVFLIVPQKMVSEFVNNCTTCTALAKCWRGEKWNAQPNPNCYTELSAGHGKAKVTIWQCPQPCTSVLTRDSVESGTILNTGRAGLSEKRAIQNPAKPANSVDWLYQS